MISRGVRIAAGVALVLSALYRCLDWCPLAGARARDDDESPWLEEKGSYRLPGPGARTAPLGPHLASARPRGDFHVLAYHYRAHVYDEPGRDPRRMGIVRRGTQLRALAKIAGTGCKGGWYRLAEGGVICNQDGFLVTRTPQEFWIRQPPADLNKALFYRYGRVITQGALRFVRMPTEREEQTLAALLTREREEEPTVFPAFVHGQMFGDVFVAIDRVETSGARRYYRTVRGRYVREQDVELRPAPKMHGELLRGAQSLPLAFVYGDGPTKLMRKRGGRYREVGKAEVHGRFHLVQQLTHRGATYAVGVDAIAVPRERVRVARRTARPQGIARHQKWIHIDLTEQTLVAYEGDEPVFATLVSSGKEDTGHATPTGIYRIRDKHASVTMSGSDPAEGAYEVSEVPWTQYYDGSYALHGAYWHDTFGQTRSHGCTNIAPSDARWLFYWTTPTLPSGFHARQRAEGTAVYLTHTRAQETRAEG